MVAPLYYLAAFAEAALSVFGIRAYEQPHYRLDRTLADHVELRTYEPRVAAETAITGNADGEAFGRLFRYITGANAAGASMTGTGPVQRSPDQTPNGRMIPMTAPVEFAGNAGDRRMRFFLPKTAAAQPPSPTDPKVRIVTLPGTQVAALGFSGTLSAASRAKAAATLQAVLSGAGLQEAGPGSVLSYDPPFTIPFLRHNEVAVPIAVP